MPCPVACGYTDMCGRAGQWRISSRRTAPCCSHTDGTSDSRRSASNTSRSRIRELASGTMPGIGTSAVRYFRRRHAPGDCAPPLGGCLAASRDLQLAFDIERLASQRLQLLLEAHVQLRPPAKQQIRSRATHRAS